jgi:hypothetical protein
MTDLERYHAACHAMQSGVAMEMNYLPEPTQPKHLRVGVNSALCDNSALALLLIAKGVITLDELHKALADQMEAEVAGYEKRLAERLGSHVELH